MVDTHRKTTKSKLPQEWLLFYGFIYASHAPAATRKIFSYSLLFLSPVIFPNVSLISFFLIARYLFQRKLFDFFVTTISLLRGCHTVSHSLAVLCVCLSLYTTIFQETLFRILFHLIHPSSWFHLLAAVPVIPFFSYGLTHTHVGRCASVAAAAIFMRGRKIKDRIYNKPVQITATPEVLIKFADYVVK